ncbi:sodium:proton antiporter, partial [Staphylococcus saprophyticus]|nr:sodium:proton antiporter [Staphylococcus saprophyticus]
ENPEELNRLRHIAFETEMDTLNQLIKDNKLSQNEFDDYCTYTDHRQRYHHAPLFKRMLMRFKLATVRKQFTDQSKNKRNLNKGEISEKTANIMRIIYYNIAKRLSNKMTNDNELEVMQVCDSYLMRNDSLTLANSNLINYKDHNHVIVYRIKLTALNEQRNVLNQLIESGEVSENIALQVSKSINYDEMMVLDKLI